MEETNLAELTRQLNEANDTLRAIRQGEVDALVIEGRQGKQVYTLQTADHPYRILVQQMNEGALMLSREGFILHANPRFGGLVRAQADQLTARSIVPWIAAPDRRRFEQLLEAAFEGRSSRVELDLIPEQNEAARVPVVVSLAPLNLESVDAICAVVTDLRERRERESLERAELMTRSVMDHATAAVVITDRDGRIVRANAAALALAKRPLIAERFTAVFPLAFDPSMLTDLNPSNAPLEELVRTATAGAGYQGIQARMHDPYGQIIDVQLSAGPFAPVEHEGSGAVFTLADVTALRTSERRFRALSESIPQIVWTLNGQGELEYCNSIGIEYFGISVEELVHAMDKVVHPDDLPQVKELWSQYIHAGEPFQTEFRLISHDREARWFLIRAVPIRDLNGNVAQWFGTSTDVDAQKRIENELRSANADLEHFAYAASHDFQEPLRMVTAFTQLLQKDFGGQLDGQAAMALNYVLEGTDRLGALLQNLLAYMRASRNPDAAAEEIDCNDVLNEVVANLQIPIEQSGARIPLRPVADHRVPAHSHARATAEPGEQRHQVSLFRAARNSHFGNRRQGGMGLFGPRQRYRDTVAAPAKYLRRV